MQEIDRLLAGDFDGVRGSKKSHGSAVDAHEHHALSILAQDVGAIAERSAIHAELLKKRGVAQGDGLAVDPARHALPCY
jgi:hypothetical protein